MYPGGVMTLADRLFLMGHDERAGTPHVHPRALGTGLAGALLAELVLGRRVVVRDGQVHVVSNQPTNSAVSHNVLTWLLSQPNHRDLRTWLAFLAESAIGDVAQRLAVQRKIEIVERRRFVRTQTYYVPTDINVPAGQVVRLANLLIERRRMTVEDVVLGGLVDAVGLMRRVLWNPENSADAMHYLAEMSGSLGEELLSIVQHTEAAIGHLALAPR